MARFRSPVLLAAAVLLLGTACGAADSVRGGGAEPTPTPSGNGIADKPPEEILRLARDAFRKAGSVRVKGNGDYDGELYVIDMHIKGGGGGKGTVTVQHNLVEILRIGKDAYLKGDADFWKQSGNATAAELLKGKYLKAPSDKPELKAILLFTDSDTFADKLLKVDGGATKGERRTIVGVDTIGVTFKSGKDKATMYVATTGKPYPMQLSAASTTADTAVLDFTEYDKPIELKPPPADLVVDTAKLGG